MDSVIISNPIEFEIKKKELKAGGASQLHVVADVDRTITRAFVHGKKVPSLLHLVREHNFLTLEYSSRAFALFDKYHPIELDTSLPLAFRAQKMAEWTSEHVSLMGKCGMSKSAVQKITRELPFPLREGFPAFAKELNTKKIPLLLFSASVTDLIEGLLQRENIFFPNVYVISNKYAFDANGNVLGYESTPIHSLNKGEIAVKDKSFYRQILQRRNVVLLGDSLGDVDMVKDIEHNASIKICFLNGYAEQDLVEYKKNFDVLVLNDGTFEYVNALLKEII